MQLRRADGATRVVDALLDSGAEVNLVSPLLAKEMDWQPKEAMAVTVRGIDGHLMTSYGTYQEEVAVVDSLGMSRSHQCSFFSVASATQALILGYPWLEQADPQISFRDKHWEYQEEEPDARSCRVMGLSALRDNHDGSTPQWQQEGTMQDAGTSAWSGSVREGSISSPKEIPRDTGAMPSVGWRYPYVRSDFEIVEPKALFKAAQSGSRQIYALCLAGNADRTKGGSGPNVLSAIKNDVTLPDWLRDYADVFDAASAGVLPAHSKHEHSIETEGSDPPYGPLYNLSVTELKVLREYLDDALAKGWIRPSTSPAGAPILFVPKKDGGLRLCVDYRGLNKVTKKNRYPLPLISETLDRMVGAAVFTKLDLKDAYHRLRIKMGDEWKTAFRTRYGHFEYLVMPFGLANAPATFQAYINHAMQGLLDVVCVVYLDDILIYSADANTHRADVKRILDRLRKFGLYASLKKCQFETKEVEFLGFVVGTSGVKMDHSRVVSIQEWPVPTTVRELQVFLGFANFYRRFIAGYSRIVAPMTDLLKGGGQSFNWGQAQQAALNQIKAAFMAAPLLRHFDPSLPIVVETDASGFAIGSVLSQPFPTQEATKQHRHPVAFWSRKLNSAEANYETHDAELLAIVQAFKQWRHYLEGSAHPVTVLTDHNNLQYFMTTKELNGRQARWAEKLARFDFVIQHRPGKSNPADAPSRRPDYEMSEAERASTALPTLRNLLGGPPVDATVSAVKQHNAGAEESSLERDDELVSAKPTLLLRLQQVLSLSIERSVSDDSASLVSNPDDTSTLRKRRQLSTGETPALYSLNASSGAEAGQQFMLEPPAGVMSCSSYIPRTVVVAAMTGRTAYDLDELSMRSMLLECQQGDAFVQEKKRTLETRQRGTAGKTMWRLGRDGILRRYEKAYVPTASALREEILKTCHDDPLAGHFGSERTLHLLRRHWFWPQMEDQVKEYIASCDICQRTKTKRHRPFGELQSLPVPERPWQEISMDFITDLPPSRRGNDAFDAILVVIDRFTKYARYVPCRKTMNAEQLATVLVDNIFMDFGLPDGIVSDRGSVFTSAYWSNVCFVLKIKRKLSTAFHPQTDGQTERQNQTLEHYLRVYSAYQQDDWASMLGHAEFAYNNSDHSSTGQSPFFALYAYHPRLDGNVVDDVPGGEVPTAKDRATVVLEMRTTLRDRLRGAVEYQAQWYNKKHEPRHFQVGEWVMLSTLHIRQLRPSVKFADKFAGPFRIEKTVGHQAYKLELPEKWHIHPVFHVSLLEPHHRRGGVDPGAHDEPDIASDGGEDWEVESILDERWFRRSKQYLVRWKGWAPSHDQWLPEAELANATDLVEEFKKSESKKRPLQQDEEAPVAKKRRGRVRRT